MQIAGHRDGSTRECGALLMHAEPTDHRCTGNLHCWFAPAWHSYKRIGVRSSERPCATSKHLPIAGQSFALRIAQVVTYHGVVRACSIVFVIAACGRVNFDPIVGGEGTHRVAAANNASCVVHGDGQTVWCWGEG